MIDKKNFTKHNFGWELENSGKYFHDKEVSISVDTKTDSEHPDKEIFDEQIKTLNIIYLNWDNLATIIEKEILNYENISKEKFLKVLKSPRIYMSMDYETNKPEKNNGWTFVLGVTESEDFGWHVEFEGEIHKETWAGD